jgi:hypothetical protein
LHPGGGVPAGVTRSSGDASYFATGDASYFATAEPLGGGLAVAAGICWDE